MTTTVLLMAIFLAKASSTVFAAALSDSLDALKSTTDASTGVRGVDLVNIMVVGAEVTSGVMPRAALVAVTMHDPGFFARRTDPLSVHIDVPPR